MYICNVYINNMITGLPIKMNAWKMSCG